MKLLLLLALLLSGCASATQVTSVSRTTTVRLGGGLFPGEVSYSETVTLK